MRASVIIPVALFAANVIAHPHGAGHQHRAKRETIQYMQNGYVVVEEIVVETITVPPGGLPSSTSTSISSSSSSVAVANADNKIAQPHTYTGGHWSSHHFSAAASSSSSSSTTSSSSSSVVQIQPAATSSPPEVEQPSPQPTTPSSTPQPSPTPTQGGGGQAVGTGPVPGPSNINPKGSDAWATAPNSMGKSILATANYWRQKWRPGTSAFVWDATLASNARLTAVNDDGGAHEMKHHLYDSSMAQCINEGDALTMNNGLTPFETAWLGWLCERPNGEIPCNEIAEAGNYGGDTGHADIIAGGYTSMGCYYQDDAVDPNGHPGWTGLWICDYK